MSDDTRARRDRERRDEQEYVERQLCSGRMPSELHGIIDRAVASTVTRLPEAERRARHYETQRDLLRSAASAAVEHLRQLGEYGGAHEIVAELDRALEAARR